MLTTLLTIIVVIVICGGAAWLLGKAPIDGNLKTWGTWLIYLVAFILVVRELLKLVGISV
jgi:hypothetical protein